MKDVVIIKGGGYGGIAALKTRAGRKDITITLIDQHPYHFLQTEGYALIAGTLPFDKTIVNLYSLCQSYGENVSFIHDGVSNIDLILSGREPVAADIKILGLAVAMGGNYAILSIGRIRMSGMVAHYVKKLIENMYKWPLWIRCRFGFNKVCEIEG